MDIIFSSIHKIQVHMLHNSSFICGIDSKNSKFNDLVQILNRVKPIVIGSTVTFLNIIGKCSSI